ncbi:MAG: MoaD/ThiS family protein [Betaproteobacteria bacterium]|nr:MoaD/ThiS family protein [Betaproteobacteria bacterium]
MQITLKLFASLSHYLPKHAIRNEFQLEIAEGSTISQVIELQKLPIKLIHLVLLNGHFITPEKRETTVLKENDALALCPPVAGG